MVSKPPSTKFHYIPFPTLQITNSVGEDKAVARANRFDDTAGNVNLTAT